MIGPGATRLVADVSNEAGNQYKGTVWRCLHYDFDESCPVPNARGFRRDVCHDFTATDF